MLLDVARDAQKSAIQTAYFNLAKTYHPDRLAPAQLDALRPQVERIFARLTDAFGVLADDTLRREYLDGLTQPKKKTSPRAPRSSCLAEEHFRLGEMAARRQQWAKAAEEFRLAVELNPDEGDTTPSAPGRPGAWPTTSRASPAR